MGLPFRVLEADIDETPPTGASPRAAACAVALKKARAVQGLCAPGDVIVAADTVVLCGGAVLGKPRDAAEAAAMLRRLSGRGNTVLTGVAVLRGPRAFADCAATRVRFRRLTEREIAAYVATGEPLDKAGAYGVQGRAAWFAERILGDYSNVVGLPLELLGRMLAHAGYDVWREAKRRELRTED